MRRLGTAADVTHAVLFLTGPDAAYISGTVLAVDGGLAARRMS
jgi:3-oxoacyl-[acyl-carrier protein] reductase